MPPHDGGGEARPSRPPQTPRGDGSCRYAPSCSPELGEGAPECRPRTRQVPGVGGPQRPPVPRQARMTAGSAAAGRRPPGTVSSGGRTGTMNCSNIPPMGANTANCEDDHL